jgi:hypothetical protein
MSHQWDTGKEKKRASRLEKQLSARIDKLLAQYEADGRGVYKVKRDAIRKMRKHVVKRVVSLFDRARLVSVANGHEKLLRDDFQCALASEQLLCRETGRRRDAKLLTNMPVEGEADEGVGEDEEQEEIHETLRLAHSDAEPVYRGDGRRGKRPVTTFLAVLNTAQRRRHDELLEWHRERVARHVQYARHLQHELRRLARY